MGTLHVIGVDFQHRLGVHTGGIGSYTILIGFLTDGLLRIMTHQNTAGNSTGGVIVAHIFIKLDRKSTRLNSSHANISYAVFRLKNKNTPIRTPLLLSPSA